MSLPSNNSRSATGRKRRKDEFAWVSICFWIESASAGAGIQGIASYTPQRFRLISKPPQLLYWRCMMKNERRQFEASLGWLKQRSASIESVESLAWCILTLFVYQEPIEHLRARLAALIGDGREIQNNATLAATLLALKCGEMIHPFMVLR